jgi:hypothetical protein
MRGGVDLLLVALLQCLSYPFHDPVLTDRGFVTNRTVMVRAFLLAGAVGFGFILLFSGTGIYAYLNGIPVADDAPRAVASAFGMACLVTMNIIMLSSAGSTLDSALTSFSKWGALDIPAAFGRVGGHVSLSKVVMIATAILGNLPLFAGPSILKATTISGTMVMGLAPIFLLHFLKDTPRASFHFAFWPGILIGTYAAFWPIPSLFAIGSGKYAGLLGANLYGLLICTALFLLPVAVRGLVGRLVQGPVPVSEVGK